MFLVSKIMKMTQKCSGKSEFTVYVMAKIALIFL